MVPVGSLVLGLLARSAVADTSVTIPAGGGLDELAVTVDVGAKELRYAWCKTSPCVVSAASPRVAIPAGDVALDGKAITITDVALAGGRHLARVRAPLGTDTTPEAPAWEALVVAGSPPLFTGKTGWTRGEPGERSGTDIRLLRDGDHDVVVLGEIREDLRICGDDATLLEPRGLDPRTLAWRGATLQRLSAARRDAAISIEATPLHGPREAALAPLLDATDASSGTAAALTDRDPSTAWSEARPGQGQGEFVLLRTPFDVPIVRFAITVAPTAPRPDGAAPETFYLATAAGTYEVTLPEDAWSHPGEAYGITLPQPLQTGCVALVLSEAFARGKAHPEVSVAELSAYSEFDHPGAVMADVAAALKGGDARAQAAAALLERAGAEGIAAMATEYAGLDPSGRALAINVAASATSCASSGKLLVAALADADDVVRAKATAKLQEPMCGREALPALIEALKAPAERRSVAPLVALVGREAALGPLAEALGEGTPEDREAVRSAFAHAGRAAAPEDLSRLMDGMATRSPDASLDVLRALANRLGELKVAADGRVAAVLAGTPSLGTRYLLVDLVARLAAAGDTDGQGHLADLALHDAAREVRARAADLLAAAHDPHGIAANALRDPEPRVREAALRTIRALHQGEPTPVIVDLLGHDPWTFVRVAAADALTTLPANAPADRALRDALGQVSPRVREHAILALGDRNATAYAGAVRDHLTDEKEDPVVRAAAAHALGLLCDAKSTDALAAMAVVGASSPDANAVALGLVATRALGTLHPGDLASRFAPLRAKGVRPDARAAAERAVAEPLRCPLQHPQS